MRECGKRNISLLYFGHTQCVWESLDARAEQSFLLLWLFLFPFPFPSAFPFDSLTGSWFHIGNCIFIYNWHFYFNRFLHTSLSCMLTFVTPSHALKLRSCLGPGHSLKRYWQMKPHSSVEFKATSSPSSSSSSQQPSNKQATKTHQTKKTATCL